jgi:hypothetical protein
VSGRLAAGFGGKYLITDDYSGNLIANKSDFGMAPAISNRTDKIVHKDSSLQITRVQTTAAGSGTSEYTCTTDGKDCTISVTVAALKLAGAFQ